jgi:phage terminase small subunit
MARGRKPDVSNVIPLTVDGRDVGPAARMEDARASAAELKPDGMGEGAAKVWDQVAPVLAEKNRLDALFVWAVAELCECLARMEAHRAKFTMDDETYAVEGRNGAQLKTRPEVAQFNETRRTALRLFAEFGMTPSASRSLAAAVGQGDLFDDFDDFRESRGT